MIADAHGLVGIEIPEGRVTQTPLDGGNPVELGSIDEGYYPAHDLAVDEDYAYFGGARTACLEMMTREGAVGPHCVSYGSESLIVRVAR